MKMVPDGQATLLQGLSSIPHLTSVATACCSIEVRYQQLRDLGRPGSCDDGMHNLVS